MRLALLSGAVIAVVSCASSTENSAYSSNSAAGSQWTIKSEDPEKGEVTILSTKSVDEAADKRGDRVATRWCENAGYDIAVYVRGSRSAAFSAGKSVTRITREYKCQNV